MAISPIMQQLQQQRKAAEVETEYSYILVLTNEQLASVLEQFSNANKYTFAELKLSHNPQTKTTGRIRHYIRDSAHTYELTTKKPTGEEKSKKEYNIEIDEPNFEMLELLSNYKTVRVRYEIPITKGGELIIRKNGEPLQWEMDIFMSADSRGTELHEVIKLELEVDKATLNDVISYIPFEYDELIYSNSSDETERAFIADLFNNKWNLLSGK